MSLVHSSGVSIAFCAFQVGAGSSFRRPSRTRLGFFGFFYLKGLRLCVPGPLDVVSVALFRAFGFFAEMRCKVGSVWRGEALFPRCLPVIIGSGHVPSRCLVTLFLIMNKGIRACISREIMKLNVCLDKVPPGIFLSLFSRTRGLKSLSVSRAPEKFFANSDRFHERFIDSLWKQDYLENLNIACLGVTAGMFKMCGESRCTQLASLSINNEVDFFKAEDAHADFASFLGSHTSLWKLAIFNARLDTLQCSTDLYELLFMNTRLTSLKLEGCFLHGGSPFNSMQSDNLVELSLRGNENIWELWETRWFNVFVKECLLKLPKLDVLNLSKTNLGFSRDPRLSMLLCAVAKQGCIKTLKLADNSLSYQGTGEDHSDVWGSAALTFLDLRFNADLLQADVLVRLMKQLQGIRSLHTVLVDSSRHDVGHGIGNRWNEANNRERTPGAGVV